MWFLKMPVFKEAFIVHKLFKPLYLILFLFAMNESLVSHGRHVKAIIHGSDFK